MSFMHFDAFTAATGVVVPSLSGTSGSPNMAYGVNEYNGVTPESAVAGWLWGTNDYINPTTGYIQEQGSITRYDADFGGPANYTYFNRSVEWIADKDYTKTYYIRATLNTGDLPSSGYTIGAWHSLAPTPSASAVPFWTWFVESKFAASLVGSLQIDIARDAGGSVILATGYYGGSAVLESGGPGTGGCFTGGMLVLMADGTEKPIADILVGEKVMSLSPATGKLVPAIVNNIMVPRICDIYEVKLSNGKVIETTAEHPFRTASGQWVNIDPSATYQSILGGADIRPEVDGQLQNGMLLYGAEGNAKVVKITDTGRKEPVYHLSKVAPYHNFFVEGVCVHNMATQKF